MDVDVEIVCEGHGNDERTTHLKPCTGFKELPVEDREQSRSSRNAVHTFDDALVLPARALLHSAVPFFFFLR